MYLLKMKAMTEKCKDEDLDSVPQVPVLPKLSQGRPLLLGQELDKTVQNFVESLRRTGGVVNTRLVIAATHGIVSARNPAILIEHGGHIELTTA